MQAFWVLVSSLLFATMSVLVKLASNEFSLAEIVFFRTLPGSLLLFGYARSRRLPLWPHHWRIHAIRNLVGIGSMTLGFYAISKLALATAASLEYTAPIFLMLYAVVLVRHRPSIIDILALAGGFAGVLLLLRPSLQQDQLIPFLAGLGSGALAAIAYLQIRRLGALGEATWRTVFIYTLSAMVVSLFAMPFTPPATYSVRGIGLLIGIGITGLAGQLAMTRAFSVGAPTLAAILQYSTVVFAAFYGYIVWGDHPTWMSSLGLVLIIGSGAGAALAMRRAAA